MSSSALKVTVHDGKKKKVTYISMQKMRGLRTMGEFLLSLEIPISEQKDIYKVDSRPMEILHVYSPFKIQNVLVGTKKVTVEQLY